MGKGITLSKKHGLNPSEDQRLKRYTIVSKDIFTQKVEGCAVLMKEADFNAVFDKH